MAGRDYCGKRYSSAEELLVHLKTHTNLSTSDLAGAGPGAGAGYSALLTQSLMRGGAASQLLPSALSLQVGTLIDVSSRLCEISQCTVEQRLY